jgi:hypothetical protein
MQTIKKTIYGAVNVGQTFIMFDILMVKIDPIASVAIGHLDFVGFNQDYFDSLQDRGMIPHVVDYYTPVDVVDFTTNWDSSEDYCIYNTLGYDNEDVAAIYVISGKPCVKVSDEDGLRAYLPIEEIVEIENGADYGVLDSPNTVFIRKNGLLIHTIYLTKV